MAIDRRTLTCEACETKVVVRTAIGHGFRQEHSFECPGCGVQIRYVLEIDQRNVGIRYGDPINARWSASEEGVKKVLSFDAERPVPRDLPPSVSPFIATSFNLRDPEAYRKDETLRWFWSSHMRPVIERLMTHWERGATELFDKELKKLGVRIGRPTRAGRLEVLGRLIANGFSCFTLWSSSSVGRLKQRLAFAESVDSGLCMQLAQEYRDTGRATTLWRQLKDVRRLFLQHYSSFIPIIQLRYWREELQDLTRLELSEKRFGELRQLYVDSFETLCRLAVIMAGFEEIIANKRLTIRTAKRSMSLWDFEATANGTKPQVLKRYPVADLLLDAMDHKLRNGVGHHSAYFESTGDEIIYNEFQGARARERRLPYTAFVYKTYEAFRTLQLLSAYHQRLLELVEDADDLAEAEG